MNRKKYQCTSIYLSAVITTYYILKERNLHTDVNLPCSCPTSNMLVQIVFWINCPYSFCHSHDNNLNIKYMERRLMNTREYRTKTSFTSI